MKRAWIAVALWLAILAGSAAWLQGALVITTDLSAFLPPAASPTQRLLLGQLRNGAASRLMVIALEGDSDEALAGLSRRLALRLKASGLFGYVDNGESLSIGKEQALLFEHRYLLSPAVNPERFTVRGLGSALEESYELLGSSAGVLVRAMLPSDPTGEMRQILAELAPAGGPGKRHGVWFARDGRRALLVAETRSPAFDADGQRRAVQAIRESYAAIPHGGAGLVLSGPGVFASAVRDSVEQELWRLSLVGLALVLAILYAAYRSAAMLFASFLPVATGLVLGVTAVALGFGKVHGITLGFGVTLIGEVIDYPTYLFMHARRGERLEQALARIGPTLNLAILTTVFGALAMALSSFEGLAQLGTLTIAGVMAAGVTTRMVLPALVRARGAAPPVAAARWLGLCARSARRLRWPAVVLVVAALGLVASRHERLWKDDISGLTPVSESAKRLDRSLRQAIGAPSLRYLVVARGSSSEAALQASEASAAWLREAVQKGWLSGFDVPTSYLPSTKTQRSRQAALPERQVLSTRLGAALADTPFNEDRFVPFLDAVSRTRSAPLLELSDFAGTALALKLGSLLVRDDDGWSALATLRGVEAPAELARQASAHGQQFIDLKLESNELVGTYRNQALGFIGLGFACLAGVLALALRGVKPAARVMAPIAAAVVLDVALLLLLGQALSLFSLVALLLVVGVGLNYALFFARQPESEDERARTQVSLVVCAGTTLSAFGCLAFSSIPVLHEIGLTVALGVVLSLVLAAAFARRPEALAAPV